MNGSFRLSDLRIAVDADAKTDLLWLGLGVIGDRILFISLADDRAVETLHAHRSLAGRAAIWDMSTRSAPVARLKYSNDMGANEIKHRLTRPTIPDRELG